jgi:hypothetical protein
MINNRLYQILVLGPERALDFEAAAQFVDSFKLTKR